MKKNLKWCIYFIIILMLLPNSVFAHSAASGNAASYGSCSSSYTWCYSNIGLRFSVYTYKNKDLKYLKSVDYGTTYDSVIGRSALNGRTAKIATASAGKVAYTSNKKSVSWSSGYYKLSVKSNNYFHCYFEDDCESFSALKKQIESTFSLNQTDASKVRKKVNDFFGTSISLNDMEYTYVTVEPTIYIYNNSGASYYGTIHELLYLGDAKSGKSFYGINEILYYSFPRSIIASNPTTKDTNNFVSSTGLVRVTNGNTISNYSVAWGTTTVRKTNRDTIVSKAGYGVGVFWIGDYIDDLTCKDICGTSATLACAENYCAGKKYSTTAKKASCINKCGYKTPSASGFSCGPTSSSKATTTTCSDTTSGTKTTCSTSGYFKTTCTEKTTINYPDLTSKNSLYKGDSKKFNYSISTSGSKTCTKEFNYKLFEFDYAKQVGAVGRNALKAVLETSYFKNTDKNDFKYSTSSTAWGTKRINNSSSNYTLAWTSKSSSTSVNSSKSKKTSVTLYADGKSSKKTDKYNKKVYSYTNTGVLAKSGIPYITTNVGTKSTKTTIVRSSSSLSDVNTCSYKIKNKNNPTEILSCTASIESTPGVGETYSSPVQIKYVINYQTKANATATPVAGNLNNLKFSTDGSNPSTKPTSTIIYRELTGAEGETVTGTMKLKTTSGEETSCSKTVTIATTPPVPECSVTLTKNTEKIFKTTTASDLVCTLDGEPFTMGTSVRIDSILEEDRPSAKLKCYSASEPDCRNEISVGSCEYIPPAKTDKIKSYCEDYSDIDIKGYDDIDACIADCDRACPEEPTSPTCKSSCETSWETVGFPSKGACINKCCNTGTLGDYVFRPITLEKKSDLTLVNPYNAFPNRGAGANWYGFEENTAEDSFEGEPIFTINLSGDDIKKIKDNTKTLSKGQAYMPYEQIDNKTDKLKCFESSLLKHSSFRSLFEISDSWKGCE